MGTVAQIPAEKSCESNLKALEDVDSMETSCIEIGLFAAKMDSSLNQWYLPSSIILNDYEVASDLATIVIVAMSFSYD